MNEKIVCDQTFLLNGNDLKVFDLSVQMFFSFQVSLFYYDYQLSKAQ